MTGCGRVGRKDFAIPTLTEVEGEESALLQGFCQPDKKHFVIPTEGRNLLSCAARGILVESEADFEQPVWRGRPRP